MTDTIILHEPVVVRWRRTGERMVCRVVTIRATWCEVVDADDHIYRIDYDRADVEPLRLVSPPESRG